MASYWSGRKRCEVKVLADVEPFIQLPEAYADAIAPLK